MVLIVDSGSFLSLIVLKNGVFMSWSSWLSLSMNPSPLGRGYLGLQYYEEDTRAYNILNSVFVLRKDINFFAFIDPEIALSIYAYLLTLAFVCVLTPVGSLVSIPILLRMKDAIAL